MELRGLLRLLPLLMCMPLLAYADRLAMANVKPAGQDVSVTQTVRYCVDPDWLPYEGNREGKHLGISSDYIDYIESHSSLKFQLVPTSSWTETLSFLQSGQCDLTPMLNKTLIRETYLHFSDVYFRSPNVLVSLKDQPFLQGFENIGARILAVPKGYRLAEYIQHYYPQIETLTVASEPAGLQSVLDKRADLFVGSMFSVNSYIQQTGFNHLKIAGWGGPEDEMRMGGAYGQESLLPMVKTLEILLGKLLYNCGLEGSVAREVLVTDGNSSNSIEIYSAASLASSIVSATTKAIGSPIIFI